MKFDPLDPPRTFQVGNSVIFDMHDCGRIALQPDEQITFLTEDGAELDVARKNWGYYALPSLNGRLLSFGLRTALVKNTLTGRYFIMVVELGKEPIFESYLTQESCIVVHWLDSTESLDHLHSRLK